MNVCNPMKHLHHPRPILFAFCAIILLAALQGCASLAPASDASMLRQRAEVYWKARLAGDLTASYEFEEHKVRGTQTLLQYAKRSPPVFLKASVTDVRLTEKGKGVISLDVEMTLPGFPSKKALRQTLDDPWVLIDDQWYHVQVMANPVLPK